MDKRQQVQTTQPRIKITHNTKPMKSVVPPKVKIIDAANGEVQVWTTKKTTLGIYELNFVDDKDDLLLQVPIKIEVQ